VTSLGISWELYGVNDGKHPNLLEISMEFSDGKIMG